MTHSVSKPTNQRQGESYLKHKGEFLQQTVVQDEQVIVERLLLALDEILQTTSLLCRNDPLWWRVRGGVVGASTVVTFITILSPNWCHALQDMEYAHPHMHLLTLSARSMEAIPSPLSATTLVCATISTPWL